MSSQSLTRYRTSSTMVQNRLSMAPDQGDADDNGVSLQFLHGRGMLSPAMRKLGTGGNLMGRLRGVDLYKNRVRLDGLSQHLAAQEVAALSDQEAKKLLKVAQLEVLKTGLRETGKNWVPYSDFIRMCGQSCSDPEQGSEFAKLLDESGTVIVLGDVVVLRPEQVTKAIGGLIPIRNPNPGDPRMNQLAELERQKAKIDSKAESLVRWELRLGLAYLVVQTAWFMRLTFWDLSWDVMEPICFYVTTLYFMAAHTFFLKTSREPSFEGFYQTRFTAKQKRLIKAHKFDIDEYDKLKAILNPYSEKTKVG
ncbi:Calcium uniporter protein 1 [Hibiscus syriacus]|uniref:Calcium uniporter protein 1 n=2 Tax=Hibiscus syriacus TaxID=106335 RepID=A0A6A2ZWJ8_HIBSY|nr:Calcium uniporter protein 1 [Hibiscus syriacus]